MHTPRVRADHYISRYGPFADSYWPGPVGLRYSPREVCTSVARGTLTNLVEFGKNIMESFGQNWNLAGITLFSI